jgi:hypothetical protein
MIAAHARLLSPTDTHKEELYNDRSLKPNDKKKKRRRLNAQISLAHSVKGTLSASLHFHQSEKVDVFYPDSTPLPW